MATDKGQQGSPGGDGIGADWDTRACEGGGLISEPSEGAGLVFRESNGADLRSPDSKVAGSGSGFGFRASTGAVDRAVGRDKIPTLLPCPEAFKSQR